MVAFHHVLQYALGNTALDFHLSTTPRDLETSTQRCLVQLTVSDVSFVSLKPNTSNHNMFKTVKAKHCIFSNVRKSWYMCLFSFKNKQAELLSCYNNSGYRLDYVLEKFMLNLFSSQFRVRFYDSWVVEGVVKC